MLNRALAGILVLAASTASAEEALKPGIVYNALGGVENGGDSFKSGGSFLLDRIQNTKPGTLTSVTLNVKLRKADVRSFRVVGFEVSPQGLPVHDFTIATVADSTLTPGKFTELTVIPVHAYKVRIRTPYYVGIGAASGGKSSVILGNTVSQSVLQRPTVVAGGSYYNNGGVQPNSGGPYQIQVVVTPR